MLLPFCNRRIPHPPGGSLQTHSQWHLDVLFFLANSIVFNYSFITSITKFSNTFPFYHVNLLFWARKNSFSCTTCFFVKHVTYSLRTSRLLAFCKSTKSFSFMTRTHHRPCNIHATWCSFIGTIRHFVFQEWSSSCKNILITISSILFWKKFILFAPQFLNGVCCVLDMLWHIHEIQRFYHLEYIQHLYPSSKLYKHISSPSTTASNCTNIHLYHLYWKHHRNHPNGS